MIEHLVPVYMLTRSLLAEPLRREIAEHKQELLLESFGEFMREQGPPFDATGLSDLELGSLAASMLGEVLEGFGLARRES
jgi:hypothetical protein